MMENGGIITSEPKPEALASSSVETISPLSPSSPLPVAMERTVERSSPSLISQIFPPASTPTTPAVALARDPSLVRHRSRSTHSETTTAGNDTGDGLRPEVRKKRRSDVDIDWNREVKVRMNVFDVDTIDIPGHSFSCDVFLEVSWDEREFKLRTSPRGGDGPPTEDKDMDENSEDEEADFNGDGVPFERMFPYKFSPSRRRWTPRLYFGNIVEELREREEWVVVYQYDESGQQQQQQHFQHDEPNRQHPLPQQERKPEQLPRVCYRLRIKAKFQERFELHEFPVDAQDLQIEIISATRGSSIGGGSSASDLGPPPSMPPPGLVLRAASSAAVAISGPDDASGSKGDSGNKRQAGAGSHGRGASSEDVETIRQRQEVILKQHCKQRYKTVVPWDSFLLAEEYNLAKEVFVQASFTDPKMSSSGLRYPKLTWSMKVTRRYEFHLYYIVWPMFIFVVLSLPVSLLPLSALGERLGLFLTLLLSAITYTSLLRDHLPKVSYLTRLDQYVLLCQLLIACSAFESALVFFAIKRQWNMGLSEETIEEIEDRVIVLLGVVWVVPHAFAARFMEALSCNALTEREREANRPLYRGTDEDADADVDVDVDVDSSKSICGSDGGGGGGANSTTYPGKTAAEEATAESRPMRMERIMVRFGSSAHIFTIAIVPSVALLLALLAMWDKSDGTIDGPDLGLLLSTLGSQAAPWAAIVPSVVGCMYFLRGQQHGQQGRGDGKKKRK